MNNEQFFEKIQAQFGSKILSTESPYGFATVTIDPSANIEIISWLYHNEEMKCQYLTDLCGAHYPENEGKELSVIYHLHSLENNFRVRIKAFLPVENPAIATLTELFAGANWMERETFDFYGINFEGHPNLRRILNMDDMDYHPLRKEYALEDETRDDKSDKFFGR